MADQNFTELFPSCQACIKTFEPVFRMEEIIRKTEGKGAHHSLNLARVLNGMIKHRAYCLVNSYLFPLVFFATSMFLDMSGMACNCLELFELQEGAISKVFPYLDNKHWAHAFLGQHRFHANLHLNHHLATFLHVSCFSPAAFTGLYFTQDSSTVILGPAPVVLTIQLAVQVQQSIQFDKVQGKQKGSGVFEAW